MPRIRTIKPEFFDSPGTARASMEARLFFIALWCWADDYGIGTANPKQLMGFAFPNDPLAHADDPRGRTDFPRLRTEVSACFGVQWYEVDSRPFYAIPSWEKHQKNERRAVRRNPGPDQGIPAPAEMRGSSVQTRGDSALGTGEREQGKGNRGKGTGEPIFSSEVADATPRPDVEALLDILDTEIIRNGSKPPTRNQKNRDAMRLLLDRDGRTPEQVEAAIRWAQRDDFWRGNILSAVKLRGKYDQLRLAAMRGRPQSKDDRARSTLELGARLQAEQDAKGLTA